MSEIPIVGAYVLHLYCQCPECVSEGWKRQYNGGNQEYCEPTKAQTFARARKLGWKINESKGIAIAPRHPKTK